MSKCVRCGNEAKIHVIGVDGSEETLCADCHNKDVAALTGAETPPFVPKLIILDDHDGNPRPFQVEFMMYPHCKSLSAYENHEDGYRCNVYGELDNEFSVMWGKLTEKLKMMLSQKYIEDGQWTGDKVAGYVNYDRDTDSYYVVVDGKRVEWSELGKQLGTYEGFQIKIEFADPSDDLF